MTSTSQNNGLKKPMTIPGNSSDRKKAASELYKLIKT